MPFFKCTNESRCLSFVLIYFVRLQEYARSFEPQHVISNNVAFWQV